jgi:aspartyl-tRNA(Asn)/glutamyl-tRNA(Gln) amidotransferase subunit A
LDAAVCLKAMAGPDGRDFTALPFDPPDYLAQIDAGVEGMRLAWTDDYGFTGMYARGESARVIATVRTAAMSLMSLGATVETTDAVWQDFYKGYVATNYLFGVSNASPPKPTSAEWQAALDCRQYNWQTSRQVLNDYDVILSPTAQLLAPTIEDWATFWDDGAPFAHGAFAPTYTSHTHMWNWLMFPAVSVPCGFVEGLPVGLQIVARPGAEDQAFRVAHAFQKAFPRDERPAIS